MRESIPRRSRGDAVSRLEEAADTEGVFLLALFSLVWFFFWIYSLLGVVIGVQHRKIRPAIPFIGLTLVPLFCYFCFSVPWQTPENSYETVFGEVPSSDVEIKKSKTFVMGDSGDIYLEFSASDATVKWLCRKLRLEPMTSPGSPDENWERPGKSALWFTKTTDNDPGRPFSSETWTLAYEPEKRRVQCSLVGVD
jgi:hypothetical protein